jgi:hypothetical protein
MNAVRYINGTMRNNKFVGYRKFELLEDSSIHKIARNNPVIRKRETVKEMKICRQSNYISLKIK